jgi:putative PIN family toxin of toxin-antitoxin system
MNELERLVLDTNVLVSSALCPGSTPHRALLKVRMEGVFLASEETLAEFHAVLLREKFDSHIERSLRQEIFEEYARNCLLVEISRPIRICRDPRDDKFLEVAVHGRAQAIITGDSDLLALHPFRGIEILTPADYLARQ